MSALNKKEFKLATHKYIILLLCFATILALPLIDNKIIPGHDYIFHVTRILAIAEALEEGVFPVRMYVDEIRFWGTPVGVFYPGFFAYIPALLKLAGVPIEICFNFFIMMIIYLGAVSSWLGFTMLTRSKKTGFFSAVLYISSGWYLIDAYIRSALGELLGLSFLPLAIACIIDFVTKSKVSVKHYILGILSISAVIESHVLSSAFLVLCVSCLIIIHFRDVSCDIFKRLFYLGLIIFFLNASFIVPFLLYYIKVPLYVEYVEEFSQKGRSLDILLPFVVIHNFWLLVALSSFVSVYLKNFYGTAFFKKTFLAKIVFSYYVNYFLIGLLFFCLSSKLIPWDFLYWLKRFFEIMQFPWRFLGIATLFTCICGGFGLRMLVQRAELKNRSILMLIGIVCITNLIVLQNIRPIPFPKMEQKIYWNRIIWSSDVDYLYRGMNVHELLAINNQYISDACIYDWNKKLTSISFSYFTDKNSVIALPLVNYPGYVAINQNGEEICIWENRNHMMMIVLPQGNGSVKVSYKGLTIFEIADYVSLISFVGLLCYIGLVKKQKLWRKNL